MAETQADTESHRDKYGQMSVDLDCHRVFTFSLAQFHLLLLVLLLVFARLKSVFTTILFIGMGLKPPTDIFKVNINLFCLFFPSLVAAYRVRQAPLAEMVTLEPTASQGRQGSPVVMG